MPESRRYRSRFDDGDADPLTSMANLADVMLVFACGLITALVVGQLKASSAEHGGVRVEQGRELPDMPRGAGQGGGAGFESVGQVYRDPETGKLYLLGR